MALETPPATGRDPATPAQQPAHRTGERLLGWVLTLGGLIGLVAAGALTVEKMALLADPAYQPTCSINPVLSCGSVMMTPQAEVFGFANPLIGVAGFPVVVTLGVAVLAGLRLPRWIWLGLQAGVTFGVVFVHWLIYQSLYPIGALCPYCMVVWVAMIAVFWYVTLYNLRQRNLPVPAALAGVADTLVRNHSFLLLLWYLAIGALIGVEFWDYWRTLLP
ncbi:vitamin K epoxide reductase family protein [Natronosporangium hydrolyticum]|uniref:Vitamin K epoxide reductase family protein n=1 Tax=Natronosporangium hydrolyticum TaxID=2811111 RepID=A0A895YF12_9ACTN|nr:vitamin K epoxide reductase family protein [Natronosporangium hydrolyticum]QSB14715.1 vitamin K epoxide reductase family protein [Natronosporangium hydrolyticum]